MEFETFKTYIEIIKINLANNFIQPSKPPASALILFVYKPNSNLCLCFHYQGLNNVTIKNWYLLSLIDESLNWLRRAKQFI